MSEANLNHETYPDLKIFQLGKGTLTVEMLRSSWPDKHSLVSILRLTATFEDGTRQWVQFEYSSHAVLKENFCRFDEQEAHYWWDNLQGRTRKP